MGGGGKGGCQTVGYGYTLSMAYALVESFDLLSGYSWQGTIDYLDNFASNGLGNINIYARSLDVSGNPSYYLLNVVTGKKGEVYSSDLSAKSSLKLYTNSNLPTHNKVFELDYPVPQQAKINGIACALFDEAFVGDNGTQIPNYKFRLSRWSLNNNLLSCSDIDTCQNKIGYDVNPVSIIYDLLVGYLGINANNIDKNSFLEYANILKNENFGVSFIMTREHNVVDWIKEILRVIDGVLYFSVIDNKWKIYLIRYKEDELPIEFNEYNTNDVSIKTGDWSNVLTTFTFKYSNVITGLTESFTIRNEALIQIIGYEKPKTYTFQLISNPNTMNIVAQKIIQKNGKPLSTLKAKLNFMDFPSIHIGQLVKVDMPDLKVPEMFFRIIKIGGDKEWQTYIEIEAIEDIYRTPVLNNLYSDSDAGASNLKVYYIYSTPQHYDLIPLNNLLYNPNVEQRFYNVIPVCSKVNTNEIIFGFGVQDKADGRTFNVDSLIYGVLDETITDGEELDLVTQIKIKNIEGYLSSAVLSDEDWQKLKITVLIDNELISVKEVSYDSSTNTAVLKGLIRNLNGNKSAHSADSKVWIYINYFRNLTNISENTFDLNYSFWYKNLYNNSEKVDLEKTIDDTFVFTPLPPVNVYIKATENKLYFSEALRGNLSGDLQDCDTITAGDSEKNTEDYLEFNIYEGNILIMSYDPLSDDTIIEIDVNGYNINDIYVESVYKDIYKSDKIKALVI